MNISRPIAVVLVTTIALLMSHSSASAQTRESAGIAPVPSEDAQISGTLPDSRAGAVTMQRLTGDPSVTYGALPSIGFTTWFDEQYWNDNFYQVDALVPLNLTPGVDFFYTHFAVAGTGDGKAVGNFGLGYGRYFEGLDRLVRSTFYLDVDGQPTNAKSQLALQMENLGEYVDVRGEIGIVLNDTYDVVSQGFTGGTTFRDNRILLDTIRRTETSFHHANVEIGGPLAFLGQYGINVYGQAYYLWEGDSDRETLGAQVRGEWQVTEDITFNVHHSNDSIFESSTWFNLILTTPDGPPQHLFSQIPVRERFTKRPVRNGRVPTFRETTRPSIAAINPDTGSNYVVAHIDPNAAGNGNGLFETPYNSVENFQLANPDGGLSNIIYVRPNFTSPQVNLAATGDGMVLADSQFLLSSTRTHLLPVGFAPVFAAITGLDLGSPDPVLTNSSVAPSNIVIASDRNFISGFTFQGDNLHVGIRGDSDSDPTNGIDGTIGNLIVRNNTFLNNTTGILIDDLYDTAPFPLLPTGGVIANNTFDGNGVGFDITLDTTNVGGSTTLTMAIIGNTVENSASDGGRLISNGPGAFVDLTGRDIDGDGSIDEVFAANLFENNGGNGMTLEAHLGGNMAVNVGALPGFVQPAAPLPAVIFNTFTGNGQAGLLVNATSDDLTGIPSVISGTIIANNFSDPATGADGLRLIATGDTGTLAFLDFGSTAGNPGQVPVLSGANSTLGLFAGTIDQNIFDRTNSGDDGILIDLIDASGDFDITRNSFVATGNPLAGMGIDASVFANPFPLGNPNAQLLMTVGNGNPVLGNLFDGNRDAGIAFRGRGFIGSPPAALNRSFVQISNNIIRNTANDPLTANFNDPNGDGVFIQREDGAIFTAVIGDGVPGNNINGNLITGNTGAGVRLVSGNGVDQQAANGFIATALFMDNNVIDGNGEGFGADLFADTVIQVVAVRNSITNSEGNGVRVFTGNNSSFGLGVQPTLGEDQNGDTFFQPWEDVNLNGIFDGPPSSFASVFDSNFIQGFGNNGFNFISVQGSYQNVIISGTQLATNGSQIRTRIDGQGAGNNGINIQASGSQSVQGAPSSSWTIQGTDILNVGNDGIGIVSNVGTNNFNIGGTTLDQRVTVTGSGDDGLNVAASGVAVNTFNLNRFSSVGNAGDGADFLQTGNNTLFVNILNSRFNNNGQTGLTADNRAVPVFGPIGQSFYNIGIDAGGNIQGNEFNNNDFQGIFFQTLSVLTGDANIAGFFDSPDALIPPFPAGTAPQNVQGVNDAGVLDSFYFANGIAELGNYANPGNTSVNAISRLNFYGNQVLSNGTPNSQADGMVLSVGTNTQMIASVDANLFGGNSLSDFRTIVVVSQNPVNSQDNIVANVDRLRYDPVAFLDLAFGENFAVLPPNGSAPTGPGFGNIGESINITTMGVNSSVVGRTEVGVFTNSDHVKPINRNALGFFNIYVTAPGDLNGTNVFSQTPNILTQFNNANIFIPLRTTTAGNVIDGPFNTINFTGAVFP